MVLASGAECAPLGHPEFFTASGAAFYAAALEVYQMGLNLTTAQKTVAEYWADGAGATGTPPGHWIAIVGQLARTDGLSLAAAAAAVLSAMFGIRAFTDTTHADYSLMPLQEPRSSGSFDESAQEAAASRLYGGIRFPFDNHDGLSAGQCIGRAIIGRVRFRHEDID